jgi:SAM-dependent methyltransferase
VRNWSGLPADIHGCDVDPRLVSWCGDHLPFGHFDVNRLSPPLPYPDDRFDLVYALSVFTHLPEALQRAWIAELRRVVRPGGWLLITTHGARYVSELTPSERLRFEAGALVVRHEERAGTNVCGAYHPPAWVRSRLTERLELIEHVPEGAAGNPWQDLYLLRRH